MLKPLISCTLNFGPCKMVSVEKWTFVDFSLPCMDKNERDKEDEKINNYSPLQMRKKKVSNINKSLPSVGVLFGVVHRRVP